MHACVRDCARACTCVCARIRACVRLSARACPLPLPLVLLFCACVGDYFNIVDNMIHMMEKYTDHLEDLVMDRTKQLEEEKAKTDELLYRMLPK